MVAVLRLTYDKSLERLRSGDEFVSLGQFSNEEGTPQLKMHISTHKTEGFKIDVDLIRNFFIASRGLRVMLTLVTDATHPMTPLPFKYLSLYKVLELEMRAKGRWIGLQELLVKFEKDFKALEISKAKLINFLHRYRDKCAHIRTGGLDELGLTGLESADSKTVRAFLPLFRRIVVTMLNDRYGDRIKLGA
jgi:hypothetical protein